MPIYVFTCEDCERAVEELRKMGDDTPPEDANSCSKTGKPCKLSRCITAPGLKFVGAGWGGWTPSADGNVLQRQVPGKRNYTKYGKPTKKPSTSTD